LKKLAEKVVKGRKYEIKQKYKRKNSILKKWLVIIAAILFTILPFIINAYWVDVLFFFGIYALLGLSLNIVFRRSRAF